MTKEEMYQKALEEFCSKIEAETEFIIGMSPDFRPTYNIREESVFSVTRDKIDGRYYYIVLSDDLNVFNKSFELFEKYMREHTGTSIYIEDQEKYVNVLDNTKIYLDNIYDIDSLTSAPTLEELYARMEFTCKALNFHIFAKQPQLQ